MVSSRIVSAVVATAFSLAGVAAMAGTANAATADFPAQAKAAGLTEGQAAALQAKAESYLASLGGKQIAPDKIDLNGEGVVYLAVPGEAKPRNLSGGAAASSLAEDPCFVGEHGAADGHFCAYSDPNFTGDAIDAYHCTKYSLPDWGGIGSWINHQTSGVRAKFYGQSGNLLYTTPAPDSWERNYNWSPVWSIKPC